MEHAARLRHVDDIESHNTHPGLLALILNVCIHTDAFSLGCNYTILWLNLGP
jgi:hypothetical protein